MDPAHEARQMAEVQLRLQARFPDLDPTLVEAAIQVAAAGITGPVREYVPLLVERAARERLNRAVAGGLAPVDDAGPVHDTASPELGQPESDRAVTPG